VRKFRAHPSTRTAHYYFCGAGLRVAGVAGAGLGAGAVLGAGAFSAGLPSSAGNIGLISGYSVDIPRSTVSAAFCSISTPIRWDCWLTSGSAFTTRFPSGVS